MAIKSASNFSISSVGDGVTNVVTIPLASARVFLSQPTEMGNGYTANAVLDLTVNKPSDVMGVYCPTGGIPAVTQASITTLGTVLQVTFETPPPLNVPFTIAGRFVF